MIKSKRAWIAVTEAVVGIVLLFVFVMLALGQVQKEDSREVDFNALFINEIENNQSLRTEILAGNEPYVNNSLNAFLSKFNNYELDVCIVNMRESCSSSIADREVIAIDYFVSATSTNKNYKKLRIFLWEQKD